MYLLRVDHLIYERKGGGTFTLVQALSELRGCGNARVLRLDGTEVIRNAGSDTGPLLHVPSGTQVQRRPTTWYRRRRCT